MIASQFHSEMIRWRKQPSGSASENRWYYYQPGPATYPLYEWHRGWGIFAAVWFSAGPMPWATRVRLGTADSVAEAATLVIQHMARGGGGGGGCGHEH